MPLLSAHLLEQPPTRPCPSCTPRRSVQFRVGRVVREATPLPSSAQPARSFRPHPNTSPISVAREASAAGRARSRTFLRARSHPGAGPDAIAEAAWLAAEHASAPGIVRCRRGWSGCEHRVQVLSLGVRSRPICIGHARGPPRGECVRTPLSHGGAGALRSTPDAPGLLFFAYSDR